jgi:flagellar basal body rod protein FlgC
MVAVPNVDPLQELTNLAEAKLGFALNLQTFRAAAEMIRSLYDDVHHEHD